LNEFDRFVTRRPAEACPLCGHVIDAHSDLESGDPPREGDLSVCIRCGGLLTFTADRTLRILRDGEYAELPLEQRHVLADHRRKIRMLYCDHKFLGSNACAKCGVTVEMLAIADRIKASLKAGG
jgi:hypothetical protein